LKNILFQSGYYLNEFGGESTRPLTRAFVVHFNIFYDDDAAIEIQKN
jgi:hypothetical protein